MKKISPLILFLSISLFCFASTDKREADDLFTVAQKSFNDKLYLSSSKKFEEFVSRFENSSHAERAHLLLGQSLFHLKNWKRAIAEFNNVIARDKDDAPLAQFWLGRVYYEMKRYHKAEEIFLEVLPLFNEKPEEAQLLLSLGMAQFKSGDFVKARSSFTVVVKKYPDYPDTPMAALKIAETYYRNKNYEKAIISFKQFIGSYPASELVPQAYYFLGESYYNTFNWQKSIEAYKKILTHKKTTPQQRANALYSLGWAEDKNNNLKESLRYFARYKETGYASKNKRGKKKNISLIPLVNFKIGEIYFKMGEYEKASLYFAMLKTNQTYGKRAIAWQAESLYYQGKYELAKSFYDRILADKNSQLYTEALQGKGRCYMNLGDYAAATLLFQEAIEKSTSIDEIVESRRALAQISRKRGRIDKAISQINDILKEYGQKIPRDEFLYYLGTLHFDKREFDKAEANYRKVITDFPLKQTAVRARQSLGDLMRFKGRYDLAADEYKEILSMTQATALQKESALYYQGLSLFNSRDYHKAQKVFTKALATYPNGRLSYDFNRQIIRCLIAKEDIKAAEAGFQKMLVDFEKSNKLSNILYDFGMFYYEQQEYLKARVQLRRLITEFPDDPLVDDAQYYLGKSAAALDLVDQALEQWEKIYNSGNNTFHDTVPIDIVELLIQKQRYNEAVLKASHFLRHATKPSQRQMLSFLEGKVFFLLKDWRNAIKSLKPVIEGEKNNTAMLAEVFMGDAYINSDKDYENASLHYMNAIYLYKQDDETFTATSLKLAKAFIALKQYDEAKKIIRKAYAKKTKIGPEGAILLNTIKQLESQK